MKAVKSIKNERRGQLKKLGLEEADIEAAVMAGEVARNNASLLHPRMFPGYFAFAERIRVLREKLLLRGWRVNFEKGLEMVVNSDSSVAILISTGDKATGNKDQTLKSKYSKGFATEKLVENNQQLSFGEDTLGRMMSPPKKVPSMLCWYLMVYPSSTEIRYELALPSVLDNTNKLSGWKERIIFDPISLSSDITTKTSTASETNDEQEIVVSVTKKA